MIRILIPVVLLLLGLGGGLAAGVISMRGGGDHHGEDPAAHGEMAGDDHGAGDAHGTDDHAANDHGGGHDDGHMHSNDPEYVRLNNQFVVPIVRHGNVRSMVVLSLTLEVAPGRNEAVFQREPRLRDAFLRVMFAHANAGGFDGSFTEAAAMMPLREALREAAIDVLGEIAMDVLIVDIVRQDA
ncbi:flagellar basal body-associated FliL family protein [Rhodophyticola sp. CCM32]|uniref:flagellar basal body-associated FliL family protein n=1 Tax=Rhodophyticola sp. CCM32 TaxID=2916397 RepID=UPI00107F2E05|nr:flagellar basal body-associated FliL family protein [Rhodophyticola sp. CCM32]QBY02220.1 flagellar basal body-associated FliL family protein [Rhodophyticola sp. CCM32]